MDPIGAQEGGRIYPGRATTPRPAPGSREERLAQWVSVFHRENRLKADGSTQGARATTRVRRQARPTPGPFPPRLA